jgi:hypothetical protein
MMMNARGCLQIGPGCRALPVLRASTLVFGGRRVCGMRVEKCHVVVMIVLALQWTLLLLSMWRRVRSSYEMKRMIVDFEGKYRYI